MYPMLSKIGSALIAWMLSKNKCICICCLRETRRPNTTVCYCVLTHKQHRKVKESWWIRKCNIWHICPYILTLQKSLDFCIYIFARALCAGNTCVNREEPFLCLRGWLHPDMNTIGPGITMWPGWSNHKWTVLSTWVHTWLYNVSPHISWVTPYHWISVPRSVCQ